METEEGETVMLKSLAAGGGGALPLPQPLKPTANASNEHNGWFTEVFPVGAAREWRPQ